jgi:release factor glutamine methyltransferase
MLVELAYQQLLQNLETLYEKREATNIANWVIEHITGLSRMDRIVHKSSQLSIDQAQELTFKTNQLLQSVPVQYVLNEAWFAGLKLYVDPAVLIPRPETEELVDWILKNDAVKDFQHFLDIGTGSGCIPITLKLKKQEAYVLSVDKSADALLIAKKNATQLNAHVYFKQLDILDESKWQSLPPFDCIVSNPPYIQDLERLNMAQHVTKHEPSMALFVPDHDPLIFYRKIAMLGKTHLSENGVIYLEINQVFGEEVVSLFQQLGYQTILRKDLMGNDRMVKASKLI